MTPPTPPPAPLKPVPPVPVVKPAEAKAGTAASTKHDEFLDTDEEGYTLIMGPPENSKTISSLMVDDAFAHERLKMKKEELPSLPEIILEQVLHVPLDFGALDGIKAFGMRPRTVNLIGLIDKYGVAEAWKSMVEAIATQKARHPDLRYLIVDTVSSLDASITAHHVQTIADSNTSTVQRGMANNGLHTLYRQACNKAAMALKFDSPIFLMHMQPKYAFMDNEQQKKAMAAQDVAEGDMVPAMSGKAGNVYIAHASMVLVADVKGAGVTTEYVYYGRRAGFSTKNRYRMLTGDEFAADLGKLYRVIGRKPKKETPKA
jgi:hypothetical protein